MTNSQDPAQTIERHVAASRESRDRMVDVPRPRTEEDALAQASAMLRIRRHVVRALRVH